MVLWLAIAGIGLLLTGPFKVWDRTESALNRSLQDTRSQTWDSVTAPWSHVGNTEIIIGVCVVAVAVVWWRTRRWWFAVIPAMAISLQATIFVTASAALGRPRPDVPHLDPAPPTSSYPSGHVGASVALYTSLAIMATSIERTWLRRAVIGVCSVIPSSWRTRGCIGACTISVTSWSGPSTAWSALVWPPAARSAGAAAGPRLLASSSMP